MTDNAERFSEIVANVTGNKGKPTNEERGELRAMAQTADPGLKKAIAHILGEKPDKGAPDTSKFEAGAERARAQGGTYPILDQHRKETGT